MITGIVAGRMIAVTPPVEPWMQLLATGAEVTVTVPAGVTSCMAYLIGGAGGQGLYSSNSGSSGAGGYTVGSFAVSPGQQLKIRVGQGGAGTSVNPRLGGAGGYPGGGSGSTGDSYGAGGGGYSGIFDADGAPIMIAGGGGGGSGYSGPGGAGGGLTGQSGMESGGGTQSGPGFGAIPGSQYQGANANFGNRTTSTSNDGGGGGGGYWGGSTATADGRAGSGGSGFIGAMVTNGQSYVGNQMETPAEMPTTINNQSTAAYGRGKPGATTSNNTGVKGDDGAIWLHFT